MRGKFITLEGIDGSGKSTLIERLKKHYSSFLFLVEPGGTQVSEQIRQVLLSPKNTVDPVTESLLFAASRTQLVKEVIIPALEKGVNIICDRYIDSSLAYQGYARELGLDFIQSINRVASGCMPDVTIFIDIDVEEAYKRKLNKVKQAAGELDRIENERQEFQQKVYDGYKQLLKLYPDRIICVDGTKEVAEKFSRIVDIINYELHSE